MVMLSLLPPVFFSIMNPRVLIYQMLEAIADAKPADSQSLASA